MSKDYAKYFGAIVKNNGVPHLSDDQYRRMMNIVFINGMLEGIDFIRKPLKGTRDAHKYDMVYFRSSKELTKLTGNLEPSKLLEEMIRSSKNV